jgi:hypothetical protein
MSRRFALDHFCGAATMGWAAPWLRTLGDGDCGRRRASCRAAGLAQRVAQECGRKYFELVEIPTYNRRRNTLFLPRRHSREQFM